MKKQILSFVIMLSVLELHSQTIKYSDLNGDRPKGRFQTYISKNGESYSVGDTIHIAAPSGVNGKFVYLQKMDIMGTVYVVGAEATGTNAVIKKIRAGGTARSGWKIGFQTQGMTAIDNYFLYIEDAIASGEVKGKGMTSDAALAELKKAKDKLDLQLITQDEYDRIKAELVKYIK